MDVVNGEYVPRKSILKLRSRENSVCSDTSESSTADFEERRGLLRGLSWEEAACSEASESVLEEEQENQLRSPAPLVGPPALQVRVPASSRDPAGGVLAAPPWRAWVIHGPHFPGDSWRSKGISFF